MPVTVALGFGLVIATDKPEAAAVTFTAAEVTTAPFESVTRAIKATAPAALGVQLTVEVTPETGLLTVPTSVAPAKKSTLEIVPVAAVATALRETADPSVTPEPPAGAVSATVGAVTLTLTVEEVMVVPLESVTLAVSAVMPEADGVQLTW